MGAKQKTLSLQDRRVIARRWRNGDQAVVIAVGLGFSPAAIYAELKRGYTGQLDENMRPEYDPMQGQRVYQENLRKRGRRRTAAK